MPNATYQCTTELFLPIISVCTLITSKKLIPQFATAVCCLQGKKSKSLLHFSKFLVIPTSISKLTTSSASQRTDVSNNVLPERKSYQIPNTCTFLCRRRNGKSYTNKPTSNPTNPLLSLAARGPPSNTPMSELTPVTTPNDSSNGRRTFAQLHNKLLIGYNGMPHFTQNCPCPFDDLHPSNTPTP